MRRGRRVSEGGARASALRSRRPAPRSVTCFAPSVVWAPLPPWSVPRRRRATVVPPPLDHRSVGSVCCGCPRFRIPACGVFTAPIAVSRNIIARLVVWAFPPLWGGCPCRAPAAGAAAAPEGTPLRGLSLRSAQRCPLRGGFFRLSRCFADAVLQGFPLVGSPPRFSPCSPAPSARQSCDIFCLARGARVPVSCSGLRPCARRGGLPAAPAPLQPRRGGRCFSWYFVQPKFAILQPYRSSVV